MRFNFCPSCSAEKEPTDFGTLVDHATSKDKIVHGYEPHERPWMVFFQIATGMVFR